MMAIIIRMPGVKTIHTGNQWHQNSALRGAYAKLRRIRL